MDDSLPKQIFSENVRVKSSSSMTFAIPLTVMNLHLEAKVRTEVHSSFDIDSDGLTSKELRREKVPSTNNENHSGEPSPV